MASAGLNRAIAALVIGAVVTAPALAADIRPGQSTPSVEKAVATPAVSRASTPARKTSSLIGAPLLLVLLGVTAVVAGGLVAFSGDDDSASPQ